MTTTIDRPSATEWRLRAADARAASAESWERSDSDGFLSQWAHDRMAQRYLALARLAENDYRTETLTLFLDGEVASTTQKSSNWGFYWVLNDAAAERFGKRFFTPSGAKNGIERDRARGFTYGSIEGPAYVDERSAEYDIDRDAIAARDYTIVRTDGAYADMENAK